MKTTVDSILRGGLALEQPERGYRFNIDAIILASFAARVAEAVGFVPRRILDLGAGCGVIGLALARRFRDAEISLIELQAPLAELCQRNADSNGLGQRVEVRREDLRHGGWWCAEAGPRLLVCNPPFFPVGRGHLNPEVTKAHARHELNGDLAELLAAAARGVRPGDALALIHDVRRASELFTEIGRQELWVAVRRDVVPLPGRAPRRLLLLLTRDGGPRIHLAPLILHEAPGVPSEALARMLGEETP